MRSVTSLFNASLMGRNIRRFWPIWLIYTVIWFMMMPISMLLNLMLSTRGGSTIIGSNFTEIVLDYSAQTQVVLNGCIGVLLAMALFSYLCSARSVGMMHSLPVSRKSLFITNYVSGLVMLFSTYLATFLFTGLVESAFGILEMGELWQWLWVICGTGFFCYSFGVLCAIFAGQVLAVPVFYMILNFLAISMYYLLDSFASVFRFGASGSVLNFADEISWLSPLYRLMSDMGVRREFNEDWDTYTQYLEGQSTVLIYMVVGAVITLIAFVAYLRRKSESAGDVVAVTWAKPVFKYGVAFCMAYTTGLGMYHLFIKSFLPGYENSIPGAVACLVFMGVVGYYIAEMLLQKSFKVFRKCWKGALTAAVGIALISCCLTLDITGFDTYLPDRGEVEYVDVYINGPSFHMNYNGMDASAIDDTYALHAAIIQNREELMSRSRQWNYGDHDLVYCYVDIDYYMKDGSWVDRSYEVYCLSEEPAIPETVGHALANFAYNEAVVSQYFLNHDPAETKQVLGGHFSYLDVGEDYVWNEIELTEAQASALYSALLTDVENLSSLQPASFEDFSDGAYMNKECELTFYLLNVTGDTRDVYVNLGNCTEKTLAALYTEGVLDAEEELAQWSEEKNGYEARSYSTEVTTVTADS